MSQLPEGWQDKLLDNVCNVERGSSPRPIKSYLTDDPDGVNWIKIGDTQGVDKYIHSTKQKITKEGAKRSRRVNPGDFILTNSMSYGKPYIMATSGYIHDGWFVLRLAENINSDFLYYLMGSRVVQDQFLMLAAGAVVKNISSDLVKKAILPLPPLPEQKRIVAILDEAFAGITQAVTNAERNLVNARELFESYLQSLSYKKQPLGNFVDIRTGKLNANAAVEGGQYPFFTCSREIYAIDNYAFDCEAILLAGNNASGDFNVKHFNGKFNAYQRTYVITIPNNAQLLYRFLYFQLIKSLKELKNSSVGVGTKFLKLGMIKNLMINVPPVEKQQIILNILEQLSSDTKNLETIYNQKLTALAELRQSILQKAFTGELTADTVYQQVVNG